MTDNTITDEKWSADTECVYVWLDNNDTVYNGAIEQILNSAQEQPQDRKKLWESLRALLNVCPNNPIQRGRRPSIDAKVIQARDSLKEDFQAGVQAGLKHTSFETLVMPRGGYTHFDADNTLADYMWEQASTMMDNAYRNYIAEETDATKRQWDGTLNKNGQPTIICGVKEIVTEGDEEE